LHYKTARARYWNASLSFRESFAYFVYVCRYFVTYSTHQANHGNLA